MIRSVQKMVLQTNVLQPNETTEYCFYRRQLDACVYTPSCFTVRGTDADVGNGTGLRTTTHCLLTVVPDLKDLNSSGRQRTNKCCKWSVTAASDVQLLIVLCKVCLTVSNTVRVIGMEVLESVRLLAFDILPPEQRLQLLCIDFTTETIHCVVGNRSEFSLHLFREVDAKLALQEEATPPLTAAGPHHHDQQHRQNYRDRDGAETTELVGVEAEHQDHPSNWGSVSGGPTR